MAPLIPGGPIYTGWAAQQECGEGEGGGSETLQGEALALFPPPNKMDGDKDQEGQGNIGCQA